MINNIRTLGILALLLLCLAPGKGRADTLEPMDLHLVMTMAGVTAGSLMLSIDPKEDGVESILKMKSRGLFKLLTGYKSRAEAMSTLGVDGSGPMPVSYDSTYETKKTERKVLIRYDAADGEIIDLQSWKRGKPRKSRVPEDLRQATIDPLTTVLQLRHWIGEIRTPRPDDVALTEEASAERTFEIFDGRRRYRLDAELLDRRTITFDGERSPALRFKVNMMPLAGFSSKDLLANWASDDGANWIELIVTDDANPLPVSLTTKGGTLATTVYLRKVCQGDGSCKKVDS